MRDQQLSFQFRICSISQKSIRLASHSLDTLKKGGWTPLSAHLLRWQDLKDLKAPQVWNWPRAAVCKYAELICLKCSTWNIAGAPTTVLSFHPGFPVFFLISHALEHVQSCTLSIIKGLWKPPEKNLRRLVGNLRRLVGKLRRFNFRFFFGRLSSRTHVLCVL